MKDMGRHPVLAGGGSCWNTTSNSPPVGTTTPPPFLRPRAASFHVRGPHRPRRLPVYLDEFVFRHNRRRQPMAAFQTLLGLGTAHRPTSAGRIRGARDLRR